MATSFRTSGLKLLRAQPWLVLPEIQVLDYLLQADKEDPDWYMDKLSRARVQQPFIEDVMMSIMIKATDNGLVPILQKLKDDLANVQQAEVLSDVPDNRADAIA